MATPKPIPLPEPTLLQRATAANPPEALAPGLTHQLPSGHVTMQVQETTTLRQVVAQPRDLREALDSTQMEVSGGAIPLGIVHSRATSYGPARSRAVTRPTAVETPEKARLRAELERVTADLRAADAAAAQATKAERERVEKLARAAFHDQRLQFENVAREFESEANKLRDLEVARERMFADARLNNTVDEAQKALREKASEITAVEQQANLLGQQLASSRKQEEAAYEYATRTAAEASDVAFATTELESRIQQQYGHYHYREMQLATECQLMCNHEYELDVALTRSVTPLQRKFKRILYRLGRHPLDSSQVCSCIK